MSDDSDKDSAVLKKDEKRAHKHRKLDWLNASLSETTSKHVHHDKAKRRRKKKDSGGIPEESKATETKHKSKTSKSKRRKAAEANSNENPVSSSESEGIHSDGILTSEATTRCETSKLKKKQTAAELLIASLDPFVRNENGSIQDDDNASRTGETKKKSETPKSKKKRKTTRPQTPGQNPLTCNGNGGNRDGNDDDDESRPRESKKKNKSSKSKRKTRIEPLVALSQHPLILPPLGLTSLQLPVNLSMPPPPAPMNILDGAAGDMVHMDQALPTMLMSWYMSGYRTGYYQALRSGHGGKPPDLSTNPRSQER